MFDRLSIDIQGVVISWQVGHYDTIYRVYTNYQILQDDGKTISYRANANDPSLSREIPIGARLVKNKWDFNYTVNGNENGNEIKDFPLNFYFQIGVISFCAFIVGLIFNIRQWIAFHRT